MTSCFPASAEESPEMSPCEWVWLLPALLDSADQTALFCTALVEDEFKAESASTEEEGLAHCIHPFTIVNT